MKVIAVIQEPTEINRILLHLAKQGRPPPGLDPSLFSSIIFPIIYHLEGTSGGYPSDIRMLYNVGGNFLGQSSGLGFYKAFTESRTEEQWLDHFLDNSEVEDLSAFKKTGIYAAEDQSYIGLSGFFEDPESNPLNTTSGKIEIALGSFPAMGGTELPEAVVMDVCSEYPLRLLTPHEKYRIHSQFDNIEGFRKLTDRTLWINPDDAAERGIKDGQTVMVTSETGEIRVPARVTENIISGAVSLNQGAGYSGRGKWQAVSLTGKPAIPTILPLPSRQNQAAAPALIRWPYRLK